MRWHILRTLLWKESRRNLANRGGVIFASLLIVAAMLLSFFGRENTPVSALLGGVQLCYVDYAVEGPWIEHLRSHVPEAWQRGQRLRFRPLDQAPLIGGRIVYPQGSAAIQIRPDEPRPDGTPRYVIMFWHHGAEASGLAPYEAWFWQETQRFFRQQALAAGARLPPEPETSTATDPLWAWKRAYQHLQAEIAAGSESLPGEVRAAVTPPDLDPQRHRLEGGNVDVRSSLATSLVLFALFFTCVYTLPSLTCEERERGVLLAQMLSPASPWEILAAKFLFYPVAGMALAVLLAGFYRPAALLSLFFWLALTVSAFATMSVGLCIASLARTQREASMAALCYMLVIALFLLICQQNRIPFLPYLALEYHTPRILQAILGNETVLWYHWGSLGGATLLGVIWAGLAAWLFRRRGWQ
ncbi:MAG: ABC transporter permease [Gemmataceae bacterium]|nr:ABC transporter permease [Gemmataceae bacterium]MDW8265039.1 ABC transporter permease [Gemmataceae bacterium]